MVVPLRLLMASAAARSPSWVGGKCTNPQHRGSCRGPGDTPLIRLAGMTTSTTGSHLVKHFLIITSLTADTRL